MFCLNREGRDVHARQAAAHAGLRAGDAVRPCAYRAGCASDAVTQDEASELLDAQSRSEYALLIGVDHFVSRADTYPSSTNNVNAMQEVFQGALNPFRAIIVPPNPVTTVEQLTALVQKTFGAAREK